MNFVHALNHFTEDRPLKEFYINSCGYFSEIDEKTKIVRLNGRDDYQIICVVGGEMWVKKGDEILTAKKGQAIVFKPGDPQIYGVDCSGDGAYYWIHFSGTHAEAMLDLYSMNGGIFDVYATITEFGYIDEMISEINVKPPCYQLRLLSLFTEMLIILKRRSVTDDYALFISDKIRPAVREMEKGSLRFTSIDDYAKLCHMSKSHFMHTFKSIMRKSPMQYRNKVIMERAKLLLKNTELTVKEIADSSGVPNSLYFSKKFKQTFGCTPTEYRNCHKCR